MKELFELSNEVRQIIPQAPEWERIIQISGKLLKMAQDINDSGLIQDIIEDKDDFDRSMQYAKSAKKKAEAYQRIKTQFHSRITSLGMAQGLDLDTLNALTRI